jgi:hypothetical protein
MKYDCRAEWVLMEEVHFAVTVFQHVANGLKNYSAINTMGLKSSLNL